MSATPSFAGLCAVVLHRADDTVERLARQLNVLRLTMRVQWAPLVLETQRADIVLVDADAGWSGLLPWQPGENPMPLIALLGAEAPGRIAWALDHGANALIAKPVAAAAVYPALVMAARAHSQALETARRIRELEERIKLRPLVLAAIQNLMDRRGLDEAAAYRYLRGEAMRQRLALEQIAAAILARPRAVPEAG
jgi:AmiR/NasT family two-component response regulator